MIHILLDVYLYMTIKSIYSMASLVEYVHIRWICKIIKWSHEYINNHILCHFKIIFKFNTIRIKLRSSLQSLRTLCYLWNDTTISITRVQRWEISSFAREMINEIKDMLLLWVQDDFLYSYNLIQLIKCITKL